MPQEKSCQTPFLWVVILGNMLRVKRSFECMIFMFYLMLLRVNQNDTSTLSSVNWFERKIIIKYACQFNVYLIQLSYKK